MRHERKVLVGLMMALTIQSAGNLAFGNQDSIERLGKDLTCFGAIRAGNADGSIPPFSGELINQSGNTESKSTGHHPDNPYAEEQPLFVITAANAGEYQDRLSPGQKALFQRYPDSYVMKIYPSHRDFTYSQSVCDATLENARSAKLLNDGEGLEGRAGGIFFPLPKNADEIRMNTTLGAMYAWTEDFISDNAHVLANGKINWGKVHTTALAPGNEPGKTSHTSNTPQSSYYLNETLLPLRDKGEVNTGMNAWNYATSPLQSWRYDPGTRRVRQSPGYGYDMAYPGSGGAMTVDETRIFSNSGHRYNWSIVGKKEIYIPYNNYGIHSNELKYVDMLTKGHINPEVMRYELHRVWVIRAELKDGYRHLYSKRDIYVDEDSWFAIMGDNYDSRGELWRTSLVNYIHLPELQGWHSGVGLYHDLSAGDYLAFNLINEQRQGYKINAGNLSPGDFGPEAARRAGR